jgi:hypothetical protein
MGQRWHRTSRRIYIGNWNDNHELSADFFIHKRVILWRIDPLLGKALETNETTAAAMRRRGKQASTIKSYCWKRCYASRC